VIVLLCAAAPYRASCEDTVARREQAAVAVSSDGDLVLQPPLGGTISVNGTDLLGALDGMRRELDGMRRELDALREQNTRLNQTVEALSRSAGQAGDPSLISRGLPPDLWNYTGVPALKVTGTGIAGCDGYYERGPIDVHSRPVYTRMHASERHIYYNAYFNGRAWETSYWTVATRVTVPTAKTAGGNNDIVGSSGTVEGIDLYKYVSSSFIPPATGWSPSQSELPPTLTIELM